MGCMGCNLSSTEKLQSLYIHIYNILYMQLERTVQEQFLLESVWPPTTEDPQFHACVHAAGGFFGSQRWRWKISWQSDPDIFSYLTEKSKENSKWALLANLRKWFIYFRPLLSVLPQLTTTNNVFLNIYIV